MKARLFLISICFSILLAFVFSKTGLMNAYSQSELTIENPLIEKINGIESDTGLNLNFYKKVVKTTDNKISDIYENLYLTESPRVLVVGDSSVLMGFSPEVVKQVAGEPVAFFTFPGLKLNEELIEFVAYFKQHQMAEDSKIVFVFDPLFLLGNKEENQKFEELNKILSEPHKYFSSTDCFFCANKERRHQRKLNNLIKNTFNLVYAQPLSIRIYHFLIESHIAMRAYKQNLVTDKNSLRGQRYQISDKSVMIHKSKPNRVVREEIGVLKNKSPKHSPIWIHKTLDNFYLKPIFWIPLTPEESIRRELLAIYEYDLPMYEYLDANDFLRKDQEIDAQNRTHMANTGAIEQSIIFGSWLKDRLNEQAELKKQPQ